jgi:hypothetical protein
MHGPPVAGIDNPVAVKMLSLYPLQNESRLGIAFVRCTGYEIFVGPSLLGFGNSASHITVHKMSLRPSPVSIRICRWRNNIYRSSQCL